MSNSSWRPKIHLFAIHSPITLLVAQLIIQKLHLERELIYIITNSGLYQATRQLTDSSNIRLSHAFDNCIAHLNQNELTALKEINLQLSFYEQLHHWISPDHPLDISSLKVFRSPTSQTTTRKFFGLTLSKPKITKTEQPKLLTTPLDLLGVDFEVYIPHVNGWMFNHLAHHPNCTAVHLIEEGSLDYVNTMITPEQWHVKLFNNYKKNYPYTQPQYTGLYHYQHSGHFKVSGIRNPRLELSKCCYYCLNDLAFAFDNCDPQMQKIVLDYRNLEPINQHSIVTQQLQAYQLFVQFLNLQQHKRTDTAHPVENQPQANTSSTATLDNAENVANHSQQAPNLNLVIAPTLASNSVNTCEDTRAQSLTHTNLAQQLGLAQHDIARKVNILVLDNLIFADQDNPLLYYEQLIEQIKARGLFYFLVKFHPLQSSATRQSIIELIAQMQVFAHYLPDDFSLEHLFAHAEPFSICCHSIGSSVLLYAATMHQLAISYQEILKDDVQYQKLYLDSNYQLRAWLRLAYLRNKQVIAM